MSREKEKGMNQYIPRYVEPRVQPPVLTKPIVAGKVNPPIVRYWTCTKCGAQFPHHRVFNDKWDFTTKRTCLGCKEVTVHEIKGWED